MKLIKKVAAGLLLTFGIPFSIFAIAEIANPKTQPEDRDGAIAALIVLCLPATALGGWLAWSVYRQGQQLKLTRDRETHDRLQTIFFQLLRERNGQLTVLHFAMEAQLPGEEAKQFLDEKAKEFNATFNVNESGDISYRFPV